jgi:hypothetical protein
MRDMRALLSVSLTALSLGISLSVAGVSAAQAQSYLGRWYEKNPAVCKTPPGHQAPAGGKEESVLVYGSRKIEQYESVCTVTQTRAIGPRTEIAMRCRSEGETNVDKETVEVVDGRLRRTVRVEGKAMSVDYRRCP